MQVILDGTKPSVVRNDDPRTLPLLESRRFGAEPPPASLASTKPSVVPAAPPIGTRLVCESFGEVEPGLTLIGEVRAIEGDDLELWCPALRRRWRIKVWTVRARRDELTGGDLRWDHFPGDYPAPGEDPAFDRAYRSPRQRWDAPAEVQKMRAPVKPAPFVAPRPAREDHAWAKVKAGPVVALGFTLGGDRQREWGAGDVGEFLERAIKASPSVFERL